MAERPRFMDDLAGVAGGAFSALAGLREEAESLVRARVEEAIRKLDLVRREDLDAVMEMAANARAGQEAAEVRLAALEARLNAHMASMSGGAETENGSGASEGDPASLPPAPHKPPQGEGTSEVAPGSMAPGSDAAGSPDGTP
ncbi:MAG: accessory factor UbiK family protein [Janthinobacterium lividum]